MSVIGLVSLNYLKLTWFIEILAEQLALPIILALILASAVLIALQ